MSVIIYTDEINMTAVLGKQILWIMPISDIQPIEISGSEVVIKTSTQSQTILLPVTFNDVGYTDNLTLAQDLSTATQTNLSGGAAVKNNGSSFISEDGDIESSGGGGTPGASLLYGVGAPLDVNGNDGDIYIDKGSWEVYFGKGSVTPGSWSGIVPEPWIPAPNACRLYSNSGIDLNTPAGLPVPWTITGYKDDGILHDTVTNNTRISPKPGYSGRFKLRGRLNFKSTGTIRMNLKLQVAKNGVLLPLEGESIGGYSRKATQETNFVTFEWSGPMLDTDYIELYSMQAEVVGSAVLVGSGSYIEFEQVSGLNMQNAVDADNVVFDNTGTGFSSTDVDGVLNELDGAGFSGGTFANPTSLGLNLTSTVQERNDSASKTHLKGAITATAAISAFSTLCTLSNPPAGTIYLPVVYSGGSGVSTFNSYIQITSGGVVSCNVSLSTSHKVFFDGISFSTL